MAQVFPPIANVISRATILGGVGLVTLFAWVFSVMYRSPYVTQAGVVLDQVVPFSHAHHAGELGIDCRYCHAGVEESPFAGMPTSQTCMSCHSQIHIHAEMLEPVRASFREDRPLRWQRVNDLPDFVYFDHSIHVHGGVACEVCHGPVDRMPLTWRHASLEMKWCLDCHREPQRFIRRRDDVFQFGQAIERDPDAGLSLAALYRIPLDGKLTNCSICHR